MDSTAEGGSVAGDGAAGHVHSSTTAHADRAGITTGGTAGDGAALQIQRTSDKDATVVIGGGVSGRGDRTRCTVGQVGNGQGSTAQDFEQSVCAHRQGLAVQVQIPVPAVGHRDECRGGGGCSQLDHAAGRKVVRSQSTVRLFDIGRRLLSEGSGDGVVTADSQGVGAGGGHLGAVHEDGRQLIALVRSGGDGDGGTIDTLSGVNGHGTAGGLLHGDDVGGNLVAIDILAIRISSHSHGLIQRVNVNADSRSDAGTLGQVRDGNRGIGFAVRGDVAYSGGTGDIDGTVGVAIGALDLSAASAIQSTHGGSAANGDVGVLTTNFFLGECGTVQGVAADVGRAADGQIVGRGRRTFQLDDTVAAGVAGDLTAGDLHGHAAGGTLGADNAVGGGGNASDGAAGHLEGGTVVHIDEAARTAAVPAVQLAALQHKGAVVFDAAGARRGVGELHLTAGGTVLNGQLAAGSDVEVGGRNTQVGRDGVAGQVDGGIHALCNSQRAGQSNISGQLVAASHNGAFGRDILIGVNLAIDIDGAVQSGQRAGRAGGHTSTGLQAADGGRRGSTNLQRIDLGITADAQSAGAVVDAIASRGSIAADGTAADGQSAPVDDGAADLSTVAGDGAAADGQRAAVGDGTAIVVSSSISADGAAGNVQNAKIANGTALVGSIIITNDSIATDVDGTGCIDIDSTAFDGGVADDFAAGHVHSTAHIDRTGGAAGGTAGDGAALQIQRTSDKDATVVIGGGVSGRGDRTRCTVGQVGNGQGSTAQDFEQSVCAHRQGLAVQVQIPVPAVGHLDECRGGGVRGQLDCTSSRKVVRSQDAVSILGIGDGGLCCKDRQSGGRDEADEHCHTAQPGREFLEGVLHREFTFLSYFWGVAPFLGPTDCKGRAAAALPPRKCTIHPHPNRR